MRGWFRTVLFWCHLATGITVGLVVLVMSVTGVLLTYEKQMTQSANARAYTVAPPSPGAPRLAPDELVARVRRVEQGEPTSVVFRAGADRPVEVAFGREKTVFVDPWTGAVLGQGAVKLKKFFAGVTGWHRWLAAEGENRNRARAITGASNLGFLFLVLSGIFLWWPRNWSRRAVRNVTWFRGGLRARARDFNWHNTIGFWSFLPLAVIVASAVVISYPWASNAVYRAFGEDPPARPGEGRPAPSGEGARGGGASAGGDVLAGTGPLLARAQAKVGGWRTITLQVPKSASAPVVFNIDRGTGGQPQKRASLTLGRAGREVKWQPFSAGTPGARTRSILRFAHTGEVLGIAGQTLAGLVSLGAALMVWTGLWLSFRRWRSWRHRRQRFGPHDERRPAKVRAKAAA
ncbi:MAG TPA: PepSY-associated TM helix domain-containing protein [Longimicrobium sp.]